MNVGKAEAGALDIKHLKYFQAIDEAGSLTAAARTLGVSQPSLSQGIQRLEARFDTTLILRGPRGVRLTPTGRVLMEQAHGIFECLERAETQILGLEQEEVGRFSLGCHESLGAYFLPDFLTAFLEEAPGIEINLWNHTSEHVRRAVIDQEIQFGLVVNPSPHPDLAIVDLFKDEVSLLISQDLAPDEPRSVEDAIGPIVREMLEGLPLIYAGRVCQSQTILTGLGALGISPPRHLNCGDLELVKSLTLRGVGVGIMPKRVAAYAQAPGRLSPLHLGLPFVPDRIALIYRGDIHRTRAALHLKRALVDYGRSL